MGLPDRSMTSTFNNVHHVHHVHPCLCFQQLTENLTDGNVHPNVHHVHRFQRLTSQVTGRLSLVSSSNLNLQGTRFHTASSLRKRTLICSGLLHHRTGRMKSVG